MPRLSTLSLKFFLFSVEENERYRHRVCLPRIPIIIPYVRSPKPTLRPMGESLFRVGDNIELWRMLLNFTFLALVLVFFERVLHQLEEQTIRYPKYHEMINKTYRGKSYYTLIPDKRHRDMNVLLIP